MARMVMDDKLTSEILATCDSIGYVDEDKYYKDPSCFECLKDLCLYLRRDDDDHSVRRLLGKAQLVQQDLLPLLKHHSDKDLLLYDIILRLLGDLTQPALVVYNEEVPKSMTHASYYLEIEGNLRSYKTSFVDKLVWEKLAVRLRHLLGLDWEKRMQDDKIAMERILIIIRNMLMVPADPAEEKRTDDENSLHDRLLMVMHMSGILDLIIALASADSEKREYCFYVLEIISLMLREQTGEQLAKTQLVRNEADFIKDERELVQIRQKEAALRAIQMQKLSSRHSRFGGTFSVKDMKAPSGRDILCHKHISSTADLSLDSTKKSKRVASNRIPVREDDPTRRSTVPVRIILKEFCSEFLTKVYNSFMHVVKGNIDRHSKGMLDHDETYYLWAMKFFMEFNRYHKFELNFVSQTMSSNSFHYVQTSLDKYHEMMVTDKEKIPLWSKRSHMALKSYQELLFTLLWMDTQGNEAAKATSSIIKREVFYMPEYRELCFTFLNSYDPSKFSTFYLKDLIETNHLFLKMLEEYAKSSSGRKIVVQSKGVKRKKKKGLKKKNSNNKKSRKSAAPKDEDELEELWSSLCEEILEAVESEAEPSETENVIPFDALSEVPIEEQKDTAVKRIAVFLHTRKFREAAILLKASREVWPDCKEEFGDGDLDSVDETLVLKSIFMDQDFLASANAALQEMDEKEKEQQAAEEPEEEENDEENDEEIEEEEEVRVVSGKEHEFDFFGFVLKYATPKIVGNYGKLFKEWETLKPFTIHCILKMFHRFVFQMDYPALICQASIFRTFQKLLPVADYQPELKEAKKFFYHFWPKFVKLCETNKAMFVEIMFWKTSREAQEIQDGYGTTYSSTSTKTTKPDRNSWTQDEEDELLLLAEEYSALPDEAKRGTKIIAYIQGRWTHRPKSKRIMKKKLVEKELMDAGPPRTKRAPKFWQEQELDKLRELYEEFKESTDIMSNILDGMLLKRSKKSVIDKMTEVGLIRDKSEVKKKRVRVAKKNQVESLNQTGGEEEGNEIRTRRESGSSSGGPSSGSESEHSDSDSSSSDDDDDVPTIPPADDNMSHSDKENDVSTLNITTPTAAKPKSRVSRIVDSDSDDEVNDAVGNMIHSDDEENEVGKLRASRIVDSDSDDEVNEVEATPTNHTTPTAAKPKSRVSRIVDSDEEDNAVENVVHSDDENQLEDNPTVKTRSRIFDSDDENEVDDSLPVKSRVSRIVDSDEDEDDNPTTVKPRVSRIVDSDED